MSVSEQYFRYLDHFGQAGTIRELAEDPGRLNIVALRHDVDYDLDFALELSYWEHRRGVRSSYYLLDSAPYWEESCFLEKCLQIQEFGHEVGLHLNGLSKWISGQTNDLAADLASALCKLRDAGLDISGVSTHGDPLCYRHGFINYWCLSELRPEDPVITETGRSAEGVPVDEPRFQITYPGDHRISRDDGFVFPLWSVSMKALGLDYEAIHVPCDHYFTDSGGSWVRSLDPLKQDVSKGRVQVLMHPLYWRGEQKIYFFLSTARSGSQWLAHLLDRATPLVGRHEFTLNHRYEQEQLAFEKRTLEGWNELLADPSETRDLMIQARNWIEQLSKDYGETNVYLERFMPVLDEVFPDATLAHVHRDPKDVVRSLINRDWYDTPEDDRHPRVDVEGWDHMGQMAKVCWYVRDSTERLLARCRHQIFFERMVSDPNYLFGRLAELGVAVYPRLAEPLFGKAMNVSYNDQFPEHDRWSDDDKRTYASICAGIGLALGYAESEGVTAAENELQWPRVPQKDLSPTAEIAPKRERKRTLLNLNLTRQPDVSLNQYFPGGLLGLLDRLAWWNRDCGIVAQGCEAELSQRGLVVRTSGRSHAHVLIGGGRWRHLDNKQGWEAHVGCWYRGEMVLELSGAMPITLYCLMYNSSGKLTAKRMLVQFSERTPARRFAFKTRAATARFNLALYVPQSGGPREFKLQRLMLKEVSPES